MGRTACSRSSQPTIILAIAIPCLSAFSIAAVLGWVVETKGGSPGRADVWWAVMGRPVPMEPTEDQGRGRGDAEVLSGKADEAPV
jgi:hypothetical protein